MPTTPDVIYTLALASIFNARGDYKMRHFIALTPLFLAMNGCSDVHDHDHDHDHNHGVPTTLDLTFTGDNLAEPLTFRWTDPENDGSPVIDTITLPDGGDAAEHMAQEYTLTVRIYADLEGESEELTGEIDDDASFHQMLFWGDAVSGPATGDNPDALISHAYSDEDAEGLPLGLTNTVQTLALGEGSLDVMLRHLPPENDVAVKTADLAETVANEGLEAIGGDVDIQVSFPIVIE